MTFCTKCGTKLDDGTGFCTGCGSQVTAVAVPEQPSTATMSQPQPALMSDEKYCFSCAAAVKKIAEICPRCGVRQESPAAPQAAPAPLAAMADEKYCFSCGSVIKKVADVCPKCGVRGENQKTMPEAQSSSGKGLAIASIILVGVGAIMGIVGWGWFPDIFWGVIGALQRGANAMWAWGDLEVVAIQLLISGITLCAGIILAAISLRKGRSKLALIACIIASALPLLAGISMMILPLW